MMQTPPASGGWGGRNARRRCPPIPGSTEVNCYQNRYVILCCYCKGYVNNCWGGIGLSWASSGCRLPLMELANSLAQKDSYKSIFLNPIYSTVNKRLNKTSVAKESQGAKTTMRLHCISSSGTREQPPGDHCGPFPGHGAWCVIGILWLAHQIFGRFFFTSR